MNKLLFILLNIVTFSAYSQSDTTSMQRRVFDLGEVAVTGSRDPDSTNSLSSVKIEKFNRVDVAGALNTLPGISIANVGPRNESVVYVRGFDLRQVPVFIDGIPVYVPYDGYIDMGRFTTFDLSEISVSKGFSSITYGPNTMGGAINLVSRKPVREFEFNGRIGSFSGEGVRWNLNAGSNLGKFYFQLGLSQLKQDHFPLSSDFGTQMLQPDESRENAYRDDKKLSVKAGFTPNENHEIVLVYANQQGEKGTPPYLGSDPRMTPRFWQWPKWDKENLYLLSNSSLGEKHKIKTRWYYDTFVNELFSYDDTTYTTMTRPYAFKSFYDDYSIGGNAELESHQFSNHIFKISIQAKKDVHRENNLDEPQRTFIDHTLSIGLENAYTLSSFTFVPGISYNSRNSDKAQDYNATTEEVSDFPSNNNSAINAQLGVFYDFSTNHSLRASVSRKTRFATIKDRYSYRMGQAIPNPDLHAEVTLNYDLTYTGNIADNFSLQASAYRSDISGIIQQIDNVEPGRFQLQNAGDALFYGYELGADYGMIQGLNIGANYSYIRRKNETNPDIRFTNVPDHKFFGFVDYTFLKHANLLLSVENNSKRYSTSYGTQVDGYTLANARASVQIHKFVGIEGGVNNLFDRNYMLVEGFPEAGRNYFINLVLKNL